MFKCLFDVCDDSPAFLCPRLCREDFDIFISVETLVSVFASFLCRALDFSYD